MNTTFTIIEGCTVGSFEINDKDISETSTTDIRKYIDMLLNKYSTTGDRDTLEEVLRYMVESDSTTKFKALYTCEQCGDTVYENKLVIK